MKKVLGILFILFIPVAGICAVTRYSDTEQKYYFGPDALQAALEQFVEKEDSRVACAELYTTLMNQETGEVSVTDLFAVCRKAGFNTYRIEGFNKCREFVSSLLAEEDKDNIDEMMTGYCPGVDENGRNPNKLASITDKTRIGDICTSSHIAMGEVVFKRDNSYSCTCMALACNGNYDLRGGACNTPIPVGTPICPNTKHKETPENNTTAKCLEFCKAKAKRENCALSGVVMRHSTKECICSANAEEIAAARQSMKREANRIANLPYYSVCFDDKGKTGGTERCVEKVFNWVNVGQLQAAGIAEEYARVRYGDTVKCKSGYETHYNDDYIQCASTKAGRKIYYEFQFDDVVEGIDNDILADTVHSICKIHGLDDNVPHNIAKMAMGVGGIVVRAAAQANTYGCKTTRNICSSKVKLSAAKFGMSTTYSNGLCLVQERRLARETADDNLARISGVDPYVFFHGPQIQGGQTIVDKLRTVISNAGHNIISFRCDYHTGKIDKATGIVGFATDNTDDVLRCYLNGSTPVDFVFEDFSESWLYVRESGEAAIQCIVSGGKFANQKCHGLDKRQCIEAGKRLQAEFPGTSGTRWDGKDCVLVDAAEAHIYDIGVNVGLGAVGAVDCAFGTKVGCVLLAVEMGGLATEVVAGELINSRVDEFLSVGTRCKSRGCALSAIRDLGGKVMTVQGSLGDAEMHAVDQTLAELVEYLEPEDLGTLTGTEDWPQIIEQLGGNTNDLAGNAMVFAQYAGLIAQFASIGSSGLRLTGRAIAKVAGKESRLGRAGAKMANFLETSKKAANTADAVADTGRTASHADAASNAIRAAAHVDDVGDTARGTDAAAGAVSSAAANTVDAVVDMGRTASHADAASNAIRAAAHVDDVGDAVRGTDAAAGAVSSAAANTADAVPTRYGTIKMEWEDEKFVLEAIEKRRAGKLSHSEHLNAVKRLDKYYDEGAAHRYAMEMRQYLIGAPLDTIGKMLDEIEAGNGIDAAQTLVDYLAPKYGLAGKIEVVAAKTKGLAQYSVLSDGRHVIAYNKNLGSVTPESFINLITHEFAHAVDDLAPHNGVIGLKLNAYGDIDGLYPETIDDIYELIPTERCAHLVGDIVSGRTGYGAGPAKDGLPTLYEEWVGRINRGEI